MLGPHRRLLRLAIVLALLALLALVVYWLWTDRTLGKGPVPRSGPFGMVAPGTPCLVGLTRGVQPL